MIIGLQSGATVAPVSGAGTTAPLRHCSGVGLHWYPSALLDFAEKIISATASALDIQKHIHRTLLLFRFFLAKAMHSLLSFRRLLAQRLIKHLCCCCVGGYKDENIRE